jgi:peptidoglycan L-alanyl-D-glutamate endopeptidase CwlK
MTFSFGTKSAERLAQVHPDLQKVFNQAITDSPLDFSITEGLRTKERQKALFDAGKSQTMNSRHLTGKAVDIAVIRDGEITWDIRYYRIVTDHIKKVAKELDIPIVCGIDWVSFVDGPHIELHRAKYI